MSLPGRFNLQLRNPIAISPSSRLTSVGPSDCIKSRVEEATGLPVVVDNVANACALSEVWFGDSDGMHDLVVVNVSEGIGTGIFANGRIIRGEGGLAGEFGHVQVDPEWIAVLLWKQGMLGNCSLQSRRDALLHRDREQAFAGFREPAQISCRR
jgi:predicted NBD/HSP70 family sugar kinase